MVRCRGYAAAVLLPTARGNKLLWGYSEDMDPELQEVFNMLVSSGINLYDTADSYGTGKLEGRSEQLLGRFLDEYPGSPAVRDDVRIATKLAAYPWRLTPKQERLMWDGLVAIYEEGLVDAVGVSNYGPKQLQKIGQYLDKRGVPLAAVQVQYSLLSRGSDQMAVKAACDDLGVALIAYSPLALGMLTGKYSLDDPSSLPGGPRGLVFRQVLPGLAPLLDLMGQIAKRRGKTLSQVAINWAICQGAVPIPGAKDMAQAKENLGALGWRLSDGEVRALNEAADRVPKAMVQNVFQTQ
ncbi:hypothetical protein COHA_007518 [Chlorella ohadii]|uniref:NADP-dependent oxidoreductase domain-containing protein n=1 Tax=Chlorella ohadii TaxID=2649997 RepID=A0AAD5DJB9_9CHLO|nr:hypothetical protein COHA_007518 [Chlorella ohadii]